MSCFTQLCGVPTLRATIDPTLSKWYYKLDKETEIVKIHEISSVELDEFATSEFTVMHTLMKNDTELKDGIAQRIVNTGFEDFLPNVQNGTFLKDIRRYMPGIPDVTQEEKDALFAKIRELISATNLAACVYLGGEILNNSGRLGKHSYFYTVLERGIFQEENTHIELEIRYHRL